MSIWQFLLLRVALPLHYGCLRAALHQLLHILSLYYASTALDTASGKSESCNSQRQRHAHLGSVTGVG